MAIERTVGIGLEFTSESTALDNIVTQLEKIKKTTKTPFKLNVTGAGALSKMADKSASFDKLALSLKKLSEVDLSKLTSGIGDGAFKKSLKNMSDFFANDLKNLDVSMPKDLKSTVNDIEKMTAKLGDLKYGEVKKNLGGLVDSIKSIDMSGLNVGKDVQGSMSKISTLVNSMKKMETMKTGQVDVNLKSLAKSLLSLASSLQLMEKDGIKSIRGLTTSLGKLEKLDIKKLYGNLDAFKRIVNNMDIDNPELEKFVDNLKDIKNVKAFDSMARQSKHVDTMSKSMGGLTKKMVTFVSISTIMRKSVQLVTGDYAKLEKSVYDLGIVSGMNIRQIDELKGSLISLSATTKISATELSNAINKIERTGKIARLKPFFMLGVPKVA